MLSLTSAYVSASQSAPHNWFLDRLYIIDSQTGFAGLMNLNLYSVSSNQEVTWIVVHATFQITDFLPRSCSRLYWHALHVVTSWDKPLELYRRHSLCEARFFAVIFAGTCLHSTQFRTFQHQRIVKCDCWTFVCMQPAYRCSCLTHSTFSIQPHVFFVQPECISFCYRSSS